MSISLKIGLDAINSYRRLAYSPWHAIAEFVDNSTQSYFNNKDELDPVYRNESSSLVVSIVYERDNEGLLRIVDNAMGMSYDELERALHIGLPPENTNGRSKYGMGLKTSASWIGNTWSVRTKKLGETCEHTVTIDVNKVSLGDSILPYTSIGERPADEHYTIIEIKNHNRNFHGRTLGKIKNYLRSMYREDLRANIMTLEWQHDALLWEDFEILTNKEGNEYKKNFAFSVNGNGVKGWVGILNSGTRANAGFSIIHCGRVVKGWPDAWRPSSLYGQIQGTNDLVNQRLVGEIHLDDFDVSHTKDDILWLGDEEEKVEADLLKYCGAYKTVANTPRKKLDDERGPAEHEIDAAVGEFEKELTSPEMIDQIKFETIPSEDTVKQSLERLTKQVEGRPTTFSADMVGLSVKGYLEGDVSPNDPYVVVDSTSDTEVLILMNTCHPHWKQLKGSEGVLNYLRHCTYDAIAEWQARQKAGRVDPDTIKLLKDRLLRVPLEIEMHDGQEEGEEKASGTF